MKKIVKRVMACSLSFLLSVGGQVSLSAQLTSTKSEVKKVDEFRRISVNKESDFSDNEVLVYIKHQYSEPNKQWDGEDFGLSNVEDIEDLTKIKMSRSEEKEYLENVVFRQILKITLTTKNKQTVCDVIEKLSDKEEVYMVTPNYYETLEDDDTFDYETDNYRSSDNYAFDKIDIYDAWDITTGSSDVRVGVIDSGINDLDCFSGNLTTGYNFADNNTDTSDVDGHGTKVASIIGASGTGVCENVTIVPLKVYDNQGCGSVSRKIAAINYANNNDIDIINMSLGDKKEQDYIGFDVVISNYNGLFVQCSGNYPINIDNPQENNVEYTMYPAVFDCANMIVVAQSNVSDDSGSFSLGGYGNISVDLAAPGKNVNIYDENGTLRTGSGTSYATPYVTGVAALLLSYNSDLTVSQLKSAILNSVDVLPQFDGRYVTEGRLNAYSALLYVMPQNKYRNYIVRNEVSTPFSSSGITTLSLGYMSELYEVVDVVSGDASSSSFTDWSVFDEWYDTCMVRFSSLNAVRSGSVANFILRSSFKNDRNYIANDIDYISSNPNITSNIVLLGDVNLDGNIDNQDKNVLSNVVLGDQTLNTQQRLSADINQDGAINLSDLSRLQSYISGTINKFF